ncbi:MAG: hypothetical protein ACUVXI_03640 [bacterium]
MRPENGDAEHYPGWTHVQFLAYFSDRASLYVACQDPSGAIKEIEPVHRGPGLRLGIQHIGDWPKKGDRNVESKALSVSSNGLWVSLPPLSCALLESHEGDA